jgi:hypothetical protein
MYVGCPKVGHVCMWVNPLQTAYTSVTSQKIGKPIVKYDKAGSIGMEDQNLLKTH